MVYIHILPNLYLKHKIVKFISGAELRGKLHRWRQCGLLPGRRAAICYRSGLGTVRDEAEFPLPDKWLDQDAVVLNVFSMAIMAQPGQGQRLALYLVGIYHLYVCV
jgi:hypothetical protein